MGPETSVRNYHYLLRNNPEGRSSNLLRGGSLKSHELKELFKKLIFEIQTGATENENVHL
jgi:hypothetical protein